ncbi:hypothetical protein [Pseudodesulfovibrio senegalensis]|uniref:Uncharacterized protein n=1 Tax=Pseudodesulfovibrio senegalensis TaxID=1721087 RepID=A0A6N6N5Q2_9BACT|nr:hypothetical protein [Pseudodesulfovibrio senegalensis]KAB1443560.1 hypothetical protein F8A88_04755 [Pseudodesulfovibrio senegalensis]
MQQVRTKDLIDNSQVKYIQLTDDAYDLILIEKNKKCTIEKKRDILSLCLNFTQASLGVNCIFDDTASQKTIKNSVHPECNYNKRFQAVGNIGREIVGFDPHTKKHRIFDKIEANILHNESLEGTLILGNNAKDNRCGSLQISLPNEIFDNIWEPLQNGLTFSRVKIVLYVNTFWGEVDGNSVCFIERHQPNIVHIEDFRCFF